MSAEPTSLMFVVGSQPLAGARVRLAGDPGRAWVTDDEGRIEATLGRGVHRFEVASEGGWVDHEVDTSSRSSLLVVHVSGRPTPASVARTSSKSCTVFQPGAYTWSETARALAALFPTLCTPTVSSM